jgi:hypothetical protein
MIKIQSIVRDVVLSEPEASYALSQGFMNMSAYAERIRPEVETRARKSVTGTSLVVALSRIRGEITDVIALAPKVVIKNITTKLPLSELVYENTSASISRLESLHKKTRIPREDFFTVTTGTSEISIICSTNSVAAVLVHFDEKPKFLVHGLASVGVSFDSRYFSIPNVTFALLSVLARARINIAEVVSTYTELVFVVSEKDFAQTVTLLSQLHHHGLTQK